MKKIEHSFPSQHSPEAVWEALTTPLSPDLNHTVNSPRVDLTYEGLGEEDRITKGTRLIYTPNLPAIDFIYRQLLRFAPDKGIGLVDTVSDSSKTRVDVIEPNQVAKGYMEYRVETGKKEEGVLVVESEFAIEGVGEAVIKMWPRHLGDMNKWLVTHGIHNPAERLVGHIPQILET